MKPISPLTSSKTKNVYLFYGDDFLVKQRVSVLTEDILGHENRTINLQVLDGSNFDLGDLVSHLQNDSLFGGNRLTVVDQSTLFSGKSGTSKILSRVIDSWKASDSKTTFRYLKQLVGLSGVSSDLALIPENWISEVDEISKLNAQDRETIVQAARAFSDEFSGSLKFGDENSIAEFLQNQMPGDAYLIFTATVIDKKNRLYKFIEELGYIEELKPRLDKSSVRLERTYFQKMVREFLRDHQKNVSPAALDLAFTKSGKDVRQIRAELEKLVTFVGSRSDISVDDIHKIFSDFHEAAFFDLNRAIRDSDSKKLMDALHENLKVVDHPLQTLAVLASEFRKIIAARELLFTIFKSSWRSDLTFEEFVPLARKARLEKAHVKKAKGKLDLMAQKDFSLFQLLKTAQYYTLERLVKIMESILQADIQIKSSKLGSHAPEIILENLILTIGDSR